MKEMSDIVKILKTFHFHKEIPAEVRGRIIGAKKRSYGKITGERLPPPAWKYIQKGIIAAGLGVTFITIGASLYILKGRGPALHASVCSGKTVIAFCTGAVTLERSGFLRPAVPADEIRDGDILSTGSTSCLVLQSRDGITIRLEPGTNVEMTAVQNDSVRRLDLLHGTVLTRVSKLRKNASYEVRTPAASASGKGTAFFIHFDGGKTTVAVSTGNVSIKRTSSPGVQIIASGEAAVVSDSFERRSVADWERRLFVRLSNVPDVIRIDEKSADELAVLFKEYAAAEEGGDHELGFPTPMEKQKKHTSQ